MDIESLACEAGFGANQRNTLRVKLERFARLVEAAEREACAKACEDLEVFYYDDPGESYADAIRKRSSVAVGPEE